MSHLSAHMPANYCITVQGGLDENWSDRLGMRVQVALDADGYPMTTLTGRVLDQAMLLGVLNYVYDLRLPIVRVECTGTEGSDLG